MLKSTKEVMQQTFRQQLILAIEKFDPICMPEDMTAAVLQVGAIMSAKLEGDPKENFTWGLSTYAAAYSTASGHKVTIHEPEDDLC